MSRLGIAANSNNCSTFKPVTHEYEENTVVKYTNYNDIFVHIYCFFVNRRLTAELDIRYYEYIHNALLLQCNLDEVNKYTKIHV